jgi:hypothetical protein
MKSLFIILFLTAGQVAYAQQPIYFEHFFDRAWFGEIPTCPFIFDSSYVFLKMTGGSISDSSCNIDFYKISLHGEVQTHKTYKYSWPYRGSAYGLNRDSKGNLIFLGSGKATSMVNSALEYRKYDLEGDTLLYWTFLDSAFHFYPAGYVFIDKHDNFYCSGTVFDTVDWNSETTFILKADSEMQIQYYRKINYEISRFFVGAVCIESDNCFYYGNCVIPNTGQQFGALLKVDSEGNQIWENEFHEVLYTAKGISLMRDGTVLLSGSQNSRSMLCKIDTNGSEVWNKIYELESNEGEGVYSAKELSNGDILGVGVSANYLDSSDNDGFIICVDSMGELKWRRNYGGQSIDFFVGFVESPDKGYFVTGSYFSSNQTSWILKLDSLGCSYPNCSVGIDKLESKEVVADVWPNPFSSQLNFDWQGKPNGTIEIFNIMGERVYKAKEGIDQIFTSHFPAGLYEIQVQQERKTARMKVVKE